jgi:uncharacterized membrane protein
MRSSKRARNNSPAARQGQDVSTRVETQQLWQGPLPPPGALEEFRKIVPDAPERIFAQWEKESAHRREYEANALAAATAKDRRGQISAATFAISALALSAFCVWMGHPAVATALGGGTIAAVVGAFLYQRAKS